MSDEIDFFMSNKTIRISMTDRSTEKDHPGILHENTEVKFFTDEREAVKFWQQEMDKHYMVIKEIIVITTSIKSNENLKGY